MTEYATPDHFARWRNHAESLDTGALRFIIRDCRSAAQNMRGWNPIREGFYEDQAFTYADELSRRSKLT
jgi:hypothetical protein